MNDYLADYLDYLGKLPSGSLTQAEVQYLLGLLRLAEARAAGDPPFPRLTDSFRVEMLSSEVKRLKEELAEALEGNRILRENLDESTLGRVDAEMRILPEWHVKIDGDIFEVYWSSYLGAYDLRPVG